MTTRILTVLAALFAVESTAVAGVFADNPTFAPGAPLKLIVDPGPDELTGANAELNMVTLLDCHGDGDHVIQVNAPVDPNHGWETLVPPGQWCGVDVSFHDEIVIDAVDADGPYTEIWDVPFAGVDNDLFIHGKAHLVDGQGSIPVMVEAQLQD